VSYGGDGDDIILGGVNADTLFGGAGNDSLDTGQGENDVFGGSGNDTITAGGGDDVIGSGSGQDLVDAGGGDDTLFLAGTGGGGDSDVADAGSGNDDIYAGDADIIIGGTGFDIFDFTGSNLADGSVGIVADFDAGIDRVAVVSVNFDYFQDGADVAVDLDGNFTVDVILRDTNAADLTDADFTF
jgi:Ca2+-binding RTX toxin-like protein